MAASLDDTTARIAETTSMRQLGELFKEKEVDAFMAAAGQRAAAAAAVKTDKEQRAADATAQEQRAAAATAHRGAIAPTAEHRAEWVRAFNERMSRNPVLVTLGMGLAGDFCAEFEIDADHNTKYRLGITTAGDDGRKPINHVDSEAHGINLCNRYAYSYGHELFNGRKSGDFQIGSCRLQLIRQGPVFQIVTYAPAAGTDEVCGRRCCGPHPGDAHRGREVIVTNLFKDTAYDICASGFPTNGICARGSACGVTLRWVEPYRPASYAVKIQMLSGDTFEVTHKTGEDLYATVLASATAPPDLPEPAEFFFAVGSPGLLEDLAWTGPITDTLPPGQVVVTLLFQPPVSVIVAGAELEIVPALATDDDRLVLAREPTLGYLYKKARLVPQLLPSGRSRLEYSVPIDGRASLAARGSEETLASLGIAAGTLLKVVEGTVAKTRATPKPTPAVSGAAKET